MSAANGSLPLFALPAEDSAFEPTMAAACARLAAVKPATYARSRNAIEGAVTRLSPYITHGLLTLPEVLRAVHARHPLAIEHKFVYELGWRAFFHHAWSHDGEGIFESLHAGPLPDGDYARELPADIREARTGVPVIDQAVRALYACGWLHNHARMWLASYVVHLRRVHWRAGADWLYGHLLDGDLASNHLSWQWVAGTGSHKPYLFNADNVARYAPPGWHSPGTVVDASYEALERLARGAALPASRPLLEGITEPALTSAPPADLGFVPPDAELGRGRDVHLIHPWSLADPPAGAFVVAIVDADTARRWTWSERRWRFIGERMAAIAPQRWFADADALHAALTGARSVGGFDDPHLPPALRAFGLPLPPPLFAEPGRRCASFSQFWTRVTRGLASVDALLQAVPTASSTFMPGDLP